MRIIAGLIIVAAVGFGVASFTTASQAPAPTSQATEMVAGDNCGKTCDKAKKCTKCEDCDTVKDCKTCSKCD
ncbi:MAG TPA: hypothetical protein DCM28_18225 [Phycisphaerales bacterium]|nr:hypothetical protein [Phycisphaerales bacterium]HCD32132.1 hypothetical protein [Phycisphaerales bacterium]|tara:strand:- start:1939 stop:2154 length:216 start_codon:yes stop_codon:yes gene_type:complete